MPDTSARTGGWRGDVDAWLYAVQTQHYVMSRGPLPDSLIRAADRFRHDVPGWSDDRALAELMRLAAMVGDGHTFVLPWGARRFASRVLPFRLYAFADGLFVIDAAPGYERWIGARMQSLAGIPERELLPRIRPFVPRDNNEGVLWAGPLLLEFAGFLEAITDRRFTTEVPVALRDRSGRDTAFAVPLGPAPRMRGVPKLIPSRIPGAPPPPLYLRKVATPYWLQALDDTAVYVQFNQVQDAGPEPLAAFARRLGDTLRTRDARLLIVDVRHNNGGNLDLLDPFVAVLRAFSSGDRHGRLVVISGRNTFSAAQVFLARAEQEAHADVVGEPSSSKPNFVGEENAVPLPWSGAIASVSNRYHETIPGDRRQWIAPRPLVVLRADLYFGNRDPVLEQLLGPRHAGAGR